MKETRDVAVILFAVVGVPVLLFFLARVIDQVWVVLQGVR